MSFAKRFEEARERAGLSVAALALTFALATSSCLTTWCNRLRTQPTALRGGFFCAQTLIKIKFYLSC